MKIACLYGAPAGCTCAVCEQIPPPAPAAPQGGLRALLRRLWWEITTGPTGRP